VFYGNNYLTVFEVGDDDEKRRHADRLYQAANEIAAQVGTADFVSLIDSGNFESIDAAAIRSRELFARITDAPSGTGYWLATYALVHLMLLNSIRLLEGDPEAKTVAENAATLYAAVAGMRHYPLRPRGQEPDTSGRPD
jgi:hypothetical protein